MQTTQREQMAIKFADCMARLKNLGLKGEVTVTGGVVMIATECKVSASCYRKAIKTACQRTGAVSHEARPSPSARVFTITI